MDILELVERSKDAATVQRVFGEPIQHGDVVVPVARVTHGGGGGQGDKGEEGGGSGGGFGATPAGVFVLDGDAQRQPALDYNWMALGGQIVAIVLLTLRSIFKKWRRKR
ncbi:spore germination protein GerW family protein [Nonomuraea angiospora]|uniref:spore germination protein GerW family protein n=1 Tax=Nonomuraea angiospora TaxID=46172 RepID=UPI0029B960E5|nr:spore germination protein GerW family protein [Nonomuraea angiospora]MDX3103716.1 spore germination protein GerW family protein [Nonomuraea angiospora]